jgi:hypothetical protein
MSRDDQDTQLSSNIHDWAAIRLSVALTSHPEATHPSMIIGQESSLGVTFMSLWFLNQLYSPHLCTPHLSSKF